jgi:hypothetical protein
MTSISAVTIDSIYIFVGFENEEQNSEYFDKRRHKGSEDVMLRPGFSG